MLDEWKRAEKKGERHFPHEFLYQILLDGKLEGDYKIDEKDRLGASRRGERPADMVPGWEDSTLGNTFASHVLKS